MPDVARRRVLAWLGGHVVVAGAWPAAAVAAPPPPPKVQELRDAAIALQFDERLRCRILRVHADGRQQPLTPFETSETLRLAEGRSVGAMRLVQARRETVEGAQGPGRRLVLEGHAADGWRQTLRVTLWEAHPGLAQVQVAWHHTSDKPRRIEGWRNVGHTLAPAARPPHHFFTYSGSTHADRRDWVQRVAKGFAQDNFLGMNASDYGGGTPVVDVWRHDAGLAVGLLEHLPWSVSLPVRERGGHVSLAVQDATPRELAPGQTLETLASFACVHAGDHFQPLESYRRLMATQGLEPARPPDSAHAPIWCAWGYEREFTVERVVATLPKVRELGLQWAVIDDGWQRRTGDWRPDPQRFPNGGTDMKALADAIRAQGLRPRLWIAPLAVAPGSDELHEHTDMLLLDKDGAVQDVTWWNSFTLCPQYPKTQQRARELVRTILGDWGFEGLKIDGQHLNGVAPCFNPAHRHARPEDAPQHLADFFRVIHDEARRVRPDAVIEVCPCGTSYAFHTMPWIDQAPASDPLSSWQVRHKGKTLKALMGRSSAYAGDHVELSDGGQDFASTVGIGAVLSTKFTWPQDPKPKDSFLLTPEREATWRRWIGLHNRLGLSQGVYRGDLYDIGFDRPETHAVEREGRMHFAFYAPKEAPRWRGQVVLRGLEPGRSHALHDLVTDRSLGEVRVPEGQTEVRVPLAFEHHALVAATPLNRLT